MTLKPRGEVLVVNLERINQGFLGLPSVFIAVEKLEPVTFVLVNGVPLLLIFVPIIVLLAVP